MPVLNFIYFISGHVERWRLNRCSPEEQFREENHARFGKQ